MLIEEELNLPTTTLVTQHLHIVPRTDNVLTKTHVIMQVEFTYDFNDYWFTKFTIIY